MISLVRFCSHINFTNVQPLGRNLVLFENNLKSLEKRIAVLLKFENFLLKSFVDLKILPTRNFFELQISDDSLKRFDIFLDKLCFRVLTEFSRKFWLQLMFVNGQR